MKLTAIALMIMAALPIAAQEGGATKVGLIYDLSGYIYHKHVAFLQTDNFDKYYEQDDSLNVVFEGLIDKKISEIEGLEVERLDFFGYEEIDNIVKNRRNHQLDRFDMLIVVHDAGVIAPGRYETLHFKGRGISSNYEEGVMIYGNLRIEVINMSNRQRGSFDIDEHADEDLRYKAVRRVLKNFYEVGQHKGDLREDQLATIHQHFSEMYRLQIGHLLAEDRLGKEVESVMQ